VALFVLVIGAAVRMAQLESASLFRARRRWHRARAGHEAAVRLETDDEEARAIAAQAWLSLVRIQVSTTSTSPARPWPWLRRCWKAAGRNCPVRSRSAGGRLGLGCRFVARAAWQCADQHEEQGRDPELDQ
jgi:hypothetical protein